MALTGLSRPLTFQLSNVSAVPASPGIYLLLGTRGIVNYIGSATNLRGRLEEMLKTGRVPASTFQYQIIRDHKARAAAERSLLETHAPRYNAA